MQKPKLLFIVGPTASGKTKFALRAVREIEARTNQRAEIINSDSIQVYQGIEIGTAKPTKEQRAQAPHHLIDTVPKGQTYTAGLFHDEATELIEKSRADWLLIVGGSGFYVQALEKGMFEVAGVDPDIREQLDQELKQNGLDPLYKELAGKDPAYAQKVKPQDTYRTLRALELMRALNKTMTQIQSEFEQEQKGLRHRYEIHKIGLKPDREELRKRVAQRTQKMLDQGLINEVRELRAQGFSQWAPMQSVGYKETQMFLDGEINEKQLAELITISTMQLAKRQMTWFKRDSETKWAASEPDFVEATDLLRALLT